MENERDACSCGGCHAFDDARGASSRVCSSSAWRDDGGRSGRIHSVESFGTVDGPGVRFVVFMQGCPLRCAYCHNPDTWDMRGGSCVEVDELMADFERNAAFYRTGGITVSGGEPLMQAAFVHRLFAAAHRREQGRVHTCLDTSGFGFSGAKSAVIGAMLDECDLVLLDVKHPDPDACERLTGAPLRSMLAFGDELARRGVATVIRHVVVPGSTDSEESCERLGRLIAPWRNVVGLELLPYHRMGVHKYAEAGIAYPLEDVAAMDATRLPALRAAVARGVRAARATSS